MHIILTIRFDLFVLFLIVILLIHIVKNYKRHGSKADRRRRKQNPQNFLNAAPVWKCRKKAFRRKQSPCGIKQYLVHRKTVFSDSLDNDACDAAHRHNHGRNKAQRFPPFIGACICGRPGIPACLVSFFHKFKSFQLKTLQRNFTVKIGQNQKNCAPCKQQNEQNEQQCGNINAFFADKLFPAVYAALFVMRTFNRLNMLNIHRVVPSFSPFQSFSTIILTHAAPLFNASAET